MRRCDSCGSWYCGTAQDLGRVKECFMLDMVKPGQFAAANSGTAGSIASAQRAPEPNPKRVESNT